MSDTFTQAEHDAAERDALTRHIPVAEQSIAQNLANVTQLRDLAEHLRPIAPGNVFARRALVLAEQEMRQAQGEADRWAAILDGDKARLAELS